MQRRAALQEWLRGLYPQCAFEMVPASEDASFRRYFRVFLQGVSRIAMDAPPEQEDTRTFVTVAELLRSSGVHVPEVLQQDLERGFLLLSDLGARTYLQALGDGDPYVLYGAALDALVRIQRASVPQRLPDYSEALLRRELELFPEWYLARHLNREPRPPERAALDAAFARLLANNLAQPKVFVHRDYHSRNLMDCQPRPGILDFQDAVYGPITYDVVSLLKDAYIEWEERRVLDWLIRYWEQARRAGLPVDADFAAFHRDFEWMGLQRHLKILGIFARLYHRDGKSGYLKDLPLVLRYVRGVCSRYRDFSVLSRLLDTAEQRETKTGYTF